MATHVYKQEWQPLIRQILSVFSEPNNCNDRQAVAILPRWCGCGPLSRVYADFVEKRACASYAWYTKQRSAPDNPILRYSLSPPPPPPPPSHTHTYTILSLLFFTHAHTLTFKYSQGTPIIIFPASKGFSMICELLLESGANANMKDKVMIHLFLKV